MLHYVGVESGVTWVSGPSGGQAGRVPLGQPPATATDQRTALISRRRPGEAPPFNRSIPSTDQTRTPSAPAPSPAPSLPPHRSLFHLLSLVSSPPRCHVLRPALLPRGGAPRQRRRHLRRRPRLPAAVAGPHEQALQAQRQQPAAQRRGRAPGHAPRHPARARAGARTDRRVARQLQGGRRGRQEDPDVGGRDGAFHLSQSTSETD